MSTEKRKTSMSKYLEEEPINTPTPNEEGNEGGDGIIIPYWRGVESKWPDLARFAYDALSIPAISTECERCRTAPGRRGYNSLSVRTGFAGERLFFMCVARL